MVGSMIRSMVMEPRPDWNALGPRLPAWFRPRLKRINPRLVPQFIPPRTVDRAGVHESRYPRGVWAICQRVPGRSGWLAKRWVWSLADGYGRYQPPGMDTIQLLTAAQRYWRAKDFDALEREFAHSVDAMKHNAEAESQTRMAEHICRLCRAHGEMTAANRVSMHGADVSLN